MDAVDRVHVVPFGSEFDRIVEPVVRYRADVVYLLEHDDPHGTTPTYHDEVVAAIEDEGIEVRRRDCNLVDVYDVLGVVTTVAAEHRGDSVRVNVSGAGTIAAIGATIACMDVSTDATAYYVEPESYAHDAEAEPISEGFSDLATLPTYPVDSPSRDQVAIMSYVAEREGGTARPKKRDLIDHAEAEALSFIADRDPANDKAKFRLLDTHVVAPLVEDGYLEIKKVGRRHLVALTDRGHDALRAFRHKLAHPE
ncbi:hypothetical protein SAMN06269185_2066 [Natronoarchaeum philippinense]|uniref:Uncharacterized protein n=1 Tax=Natronoarchaeum philippinense TaxID=558529 RepID=A0A285NZW4_NATPI|nr:DUF6293 family protein [Natronoarchaeum philippinense]SNZ13171.1 hypothetical protein SAMN06269185_2066 [Natronoarchaeum philippinense]